MRDGSQDLSDVSATYEEGSLKLEFTKPLNSGDSDDAALKEECYYLMFPVGGGRYNTDGNSVSMHSETPIVSDECVDFSNICSGKLYISKILVETVIHYHYKTR